MAFLTGVDAFTGSCFNVGNKVLLTKSRSVSPVMAEPDLSSRAQLAQRQDSGMMDW